MHGPKTKVQKAKINDNYTLEVRNRYSILDQHQNELWSNFKEITSKRMEKCNHYKHYNWLKNTVK